MAQMIGFIPARGGSKGLPGKNIKALNGKPLIAYTIEAAKQSQVLDKIIVSSDHEETLAVAHQFGAEVDNRPAELARDESSIDGVLKDFIDRYQLSPDTLLVLLQPTSPLRNAQHIRDAISWYQENNCAALISVKSVDPKLMYAFVEDAQYLKPLSPYRHDFSRRQDLPNIYLPNGAIYIFSVAAFLSDNCIPQEKLIPFVMPETESVDVDVEDDLRQCSRVLAGLPERRGQ